MIRYVAAALALKFFSLNSWTRGAYRSLGNSIGQRRRRRHPDLTGYVQIGNLLLQLCERYGAVQPGHRVLELGTGWLHWYSLWLRLFHDVEGVALDIWDNRQFEALQATFRKLRDELPADQPGRERARQRLDVLLQAENFDELYERLRLAYVIEPRGSLEQFPDEHFDLIISMHVLEHVPREETTRLVASMQRCLKPGGFSIHQIGIDDHLAHYDPGQSGKNYLRFSQRTWKRFFENTIQYQNRLQPSDWLDLFRRNGFAKLERIPEHCDIDALPVHPEFAHYSRDDLACTVLTIVHQKPTAVME